MKHYDIYVDLGKGFLESLGYQETSKTSAMEEASWLRSKYYPTSPREVVRITKGTGWERTETIAVIR